MKISIVIPCYNEVGYIAKCLQSFKNQTLPAHLFEIIVCDGYSTDGSLEAIKKFVGLPDFNCILLMNDAQKTPFALNLGLKHAQGIYKGIFGAHAEADEQFLEKSIDFLEENPEVYCVGGVLENVYENNTSRIIGDAMSSSFGVGNAHFRTGNFEGEVDTVAFGVYRAQVFEKVGYFDEALTRNQDDEFNFRLVKNNLKIYLSSSIKAKYYVRASYKKLKRQYYQYGYWKVFVNKKHKTITTIRQMVPPVFVLYIWMGLAISIWQPIVFPLFMFGVFFYLFIALIFAFKKSLNPVNALKIALTFFILHYFYGFGYLAGILDFYFLNKTPNKSTEKVSR